MILGSWFVLHKIFPQFLSKYLKEQCTLPPLYIKKLKNMQFIL